MHPGVFLSFSPFLGFQIATGLTLSFVLGLNPVAVLIGLFTNLPWLITPDSPLRNGAGLP